MINHCTVKHAVIYILSILLCSIYSTQLVADEICKPETSEQRAQHLKQKGWKIHFHDDEITVYNRTIPNSDIREVLATTIFALPAKDIFNTLSDYPHYVEFMPYVEKSIVIQQSEHSTTLFQRLNFPFPISDRYFAIELTAITDNNNNYKISWTLASEMDGIQPESGIALKKDDGYWKLCPTQPKNHTYIEYFIHTDPGGSIPIWIANQANNQAVPNVLRALNDKVTELNRAKISND